MPVIPAFQCDSRRIKFSRPALVNETPVEGRGRRRERRKGGEKGRKGRNEKI